VFGVGPFPERGLDEAFRFAVGSGGVRPGAAMFDLHLGTDGAEPVGAISASIVGQQLPDLDVVLGEEAGRIAQEADGGLGLLVGQHLRKGHTRAVVDGDMQSTEAGMLALAAQPPIGALRDLIRLLQKIYLLVTNRFLGSVGWTTS